MIKLCFILFIGTLSLFPHLTMSSVGCCIPTVLEFLSTNKGCESFGATNVLEVKGFIDNDNYPKKCLMRACGDGTPRKERNYCGRGTCDIFGCRCSHGCIKGDPVHAFQTKHTTDVYNVN